MPKYVPTMAPPKKLNPSARRRLWCPKHPLADKTGYALEARVVLYDQIGPGTHPCHWCKAPVIWTLEGLIQDALVVDHVDHNGHNNNPKNLVPSCVSCNTTRTTKRVADDELFITRANGTRVRAVKRQCRCCSGFFLIPPAALRRPNKGLYCSLSCARSAPHR